MTCGGAARLPWGRALFAERGGFAGDAAGLRRCRRRRFLIAATEAGDEGDLLLVAGRRGAGTGAGFGSGLRGGAARREAASGAENAPSPPPPPQKKMPGATFPPPATGTRRKGTERTEREPGCAGAAAAHRL